MAGSFEVISLNDLWAPIIYHSSIKQKKNKKIYIINHHHQSSLSSINQSIRHLNDGLKPVCEWVWALFFAQKYLSWYLKKAEAFIHLPRPYLGLTCTTWIDPAPTKHVRHNLYWFLLILWSSICPLLSNISMQRTPYVRFNRIYWIAYQISFCWGFRGHISIIVMLAFVSQPV